MTAAVEVRPLPIAVPPAPGETLRSWLDRLAADLDVPLGLLLARVGVIPEDSHAHVPTGYGVALADDAVDAVSFATGQNGASVRRLLLTSWDGLAADMSAVDPAAPDTFRAVAAREWIYATGSHCCPACLAANGGAWQLAWRLPWSFACTRHRVLLVDTAQAATSGPRTPAATDAAARRSPATSPSPASAPTPPAPGRAASGGPAPRAASTCGPPTRPRSTTRAPTTRRPASTLSSRAGTSTWPAPTCPPPPTWPTSARSSARCCRTAPTRTCRPCSGPAPTRRRPEWAPPAMAAAWAAHVDARGERAQRRAGLREAGIDSRRGPRARMFEDAPESAALMALLCAAAVPALDAGIPDALAPFAAAGRRGNGAGLSALLKARRASDRLLVLADGAVRSTGRFVVAGGIEHGAARDADDGLRAAHVPALLWPDEWPAFAPLFAGTGTRRDTARRFVATALVKSLAPLTWTQAGEQLGWPAASTRTLSANVVNRLNQAGTAQAFHAALADLAGRLRTGERPLVDLDRRRRLLAGLTTVPARVLRGSGLIATDARRRNAAAWLWAELTSGSPFDAPAWHCEAVTASQKEVYRRFERRDLPRFEDALREHGRTLVPAS